MDRHAVITLCVLAAALVVGARRVVAPRPGPLPRCPQPRVVLVEGRTVLRCNGTGRQMNATHRLIVGLRIDLNRAGAHDLALLPRIGPVLSRRIVRNRQLQGPFRSIDELERVRGIGRATVKRLRPLVCVGVGVDPCE